MKRFVCIICALLFAFSSTLFVFAERPQEDYTRVLSPPIWMQPDALLDNENLPVSTNDEIGYEQSMGFCEPYGNSQKFTNLVDGYSIIIPSAMSVDMSLSDICASFRDTHRTLKIFKETFDTASERLSYISYSNKFIQNTTNHTLENEENFVYNGRDYHVLQWSRAKLSKVQNDKNYYACVDVCEGARVYTFFFTADTPFYLCGGYMDIVNSLVTFDPSVPRANAYNKGYGMSDLSHLSATAKADYDRLFSDESEFKMGIFSPETYGGYSRMQEIEDYIGYDFCVFLQYSECLDNYNLTADQYYAKVADYMNKLQLDFDFARNEKKVIELTLQTPLNRNTGSNMVYEILDGRFDSFLAQYTNLIKKNPDVTVLFRPFNEMNGDWCTYSAYHTSRDPQIYVELYKYIYGKFEEAGCNNVIWVWNPNERSYPNYKWNDQSLYYPGDEYVDVYGITGYNNGTYYEAEVWRSFDEIYAPIYERALRINEKPIMITEFSCSSVGGDKIAWLENMFQSLSKYDKIKVGVWWNAADYDGDQIARPYFIDTPDGMLEIFGKYLN